MRGINESDNKPELSIETKNLTRIFGEFIAVQNLNLSVPRGTFFGFLGPNGAGKSTTIKMLTGILKMTSGKTNILGWDIVANPYSYKAKIGVVPEELALFDRLTGREYLTFVGRMFGLPKRLISTRIDELLEVMELQDHQTKLLVDYSHGMQKKIALSAALIHDPELLFLDEPFEGIDAITAHMIKELLDTMLKRGVTIFLTSHILDIVEKLCSHVAIIHHGSLLVQGKLDELRLGLSADCSENRPGPISLEEFFLEITRDEGKKKANLSWLHES